MKILKIVLFVVLVVTIIVGKQVIDKKTFNYKNVVDTSVMNYFVNSDVNYLKEFAELIDKYRNDEDFVYNIQTYSNGVVWSWFSYTDGKYICDKENLNSCEAQLEDFLALSNKLVSFYGVRSSKSNYPLMLSSSYNNITTEVNKKIASLQKVINSPSAKSPANSEEIRKKKCMTAQECTNCRDGVCVCTYIAESGKASEVRCNKEQPTS